MDHATVFGGFGAKRVGELSIFTKICQPLICCYPYSFPWTIAFANSQR